MKYVKSVTSSLLAALILSAGPAAFAQSFAIEPGKEEALVQDLIKGFNHATGAGVTYTQQAQFVIEKTGLVPTKTHTQWSFEYNEKGVVIKLSSDVQALTDSREFLKDLGVMKAMSLTKQNFSQGATINVEPTHPLILAANSSHHVAEMLANVELGSPTAKAQWNRLQIEAMKGASLSPGAAFDLGLPTEIFNEIRQELILNQEKLDAAAKLHLRQSQKAVDKWRRETKTLEKMEGLQKKLEDLVLDNDRAGVRKMLEAYLPWAVMEPVEVQMWKTWLDAIENPSKEHTTVAFRGVEYSTDKIQRKKTATGEVYAFFSTLLTKNQGSYTRRLRSLATSRLTTGQMTTEDIPSLKMTVQMTKHSSRPKASSFLSFTYLPDTAKGFAGAPRGGLLAVKMDSRRLVPNIASNYPGEIELLAPLIVFPDEVLKYHEGDLSQDQFQEFIAEIEKKVGHSFKGNRYDNEKFQATLSRYRAEGHQLFKDLLMKPAYSCQKVF